MEEPRRILIYGVCGSGKTTLARRLSERSGIPWHSADDIAWQPGWVPQTDEAQTRAFDEICQGETWILDTAYSKWLDVVIHRADLVVGLDYPRWLSFGRLLRRTLGRVVDGRPVCNGNRETVRNMLSHDSILLWHFRSFARKRARMRAWAAAGAPPTILHRSPAETEAWLQNWPKDGT